jgi:hypothetical protein
LLAFLAFKNYSETVSSRKLLTIVLFFGFVVIAWLLRAYLGFALAAAFFMSVMGINPSKNKVAWSIFFAVAFPLLYSYGLFDPLTQYRGEEGFTEGGASLGISFTNLSTLELFISFSESVVRQLFGVLFVNASAVFLFVFESIPFFIMLVIVLSKRVNGSVPVFFLNFFLIYSLCWLLGNDNLGTAVRIRMPGYIAVALIFFGIKAGEIRVRTVNAGRSVIPPQGWRIEK